MKKTGFFLTALLLVAVMMFTGCGSRNDNGDTVADQRNGMERDINDDVNDIGNDVRRGVDDIRDNVYPRNNENTIRDNDRTDAMRNGTTERDTAMGGTTAGIR